MRTTVSLSDENSEYVDNRADSEDSNAEAIRSAVDRARRLEGRERAVAKDARERIEHHRDRVADLERELERVKNEKQVIISQREENTELVRYAEQQRSKQDRLASAGLLTSIKWRVTGVPDGDDDS
ncbi:hypothetical protein OSG_eHP18_00200 [environmental Halophage eHP-18]|nr:hypothetical protein OSG_eHP17_00110 [environmental Halophage eHP-17]AFH22197.1 hypothetical protein OSG_eHP18_00200 [environmental Halophage eHP-18]AFH22725.1 hypothetical protein OSG_eHP33_00110 [environmental Halophage eHP-33]